MLSDIDKQDIDRKDTEHYHSIGEHLCALRVSKGWTQQTLGKKSFLQANRLGIVAGPVFIYSYFVTKHSGFIPNL